VGMNEYLDNGFALRMYDLIMDGVANVPAKPAGESATESER